MKIIYFITVFLFSTLFSGCGSSDNNNKTNLSSEITPPNINSQSDGILPSSLTPPEFK